MELDAQKRLSWSDLYNIPVKVEALLYILPLFFIRGYINNHRFITVYLVFVFAVLVVKKLYLNEEFNIPNIINWVALFAWNIYIYTISPNPNGFKTSFFIAVVIAPFLIFVIFNNIEIDKEFLKKLFNVLIFSGVVLSMGSLYFFANNGFDLTLRVSSFWQSQNLLSSYLMVLFLFNLSIVMNREKDVMRLIYMVSLVLLLFGILLTQTRATWVATVVTILFFIFKRPKIIFPAALLIGLFGVVFSSIIMDRLLSIQNFTQDASSIGRLQAWYSSIILIKDNFLFGYGYDSFIELRDSVFEFYLVPVVHSHNTYLSMILESGFIGFVLYFVFYLKAVYYSFKLKDKKFNTDFKAYIDGLQLSFVGLLISFFFEPYFTPYDNVCIIIWVLMSISFVLYRMHKKALSENIS